MSFFERLIDFAEPNENATSYLAIQFDHFKFIARELFLLFVSAMLAGRQFDVLTKFIEMGYFSEAYARRNPLGGLATFEIFDRHVRTFDALNERSSQRYYSLHGKFIKDRSQGSSLRFESIMQADLILYLRSQWSRNLRIDQTSLWYPVTYPYMARIYRPLEIFARAESAVFFDKIKGAIGLSSAGELRQLIKHIEENASRGESNIDLARLTGAEKIASK